jgi:stalled ribosome alternative rescue factor ArfA
MGTAEKILYKEYQKRLKENGIKQLTNDEIEKCYIRLKKKGKGYE